MAWVSPSTVVPDKTYNMNGVKVNVYLLKNHNVNNIALPSKRTNKFKGVVIHNTDRAYSADDGRQYSAATCNDAVATRTSYYISELSAWQNLELSDMNWSCGDGTTGEGNNGCISLEIIMSSRNKAIDLQSRDNGAKIAAYILYKNNMTVNDMYTHNYFLNIRNGHTDWDYNKLCTTPTPTRNCPYYIVWDWEGFRKQVDAYIVKLGGKSIYDQKTNGKEVQWIFKAVSQAAIRPSMSKDSIILGRVTKGDYYPADWINSQWFKHADKKAYSMLNDGGALFSKAGSYTTKRTTCKLNVRQKPSTSASVLTTLSPTTLVYVWDEKPIRANGYDWVKIVADGKIGYVANQYLK